MKVNGYEVPPAVEAAVLERMQNGQEFRAGELLDVAHSTNYGPHWMFERSIAVNRMIQRERKKNNIVVGAKSPYWVWRKS